SPVWDFPCSRHHAIIVIPPEPDTGFRGRRKAARPYAPRSACGGFVPAGQNGKGTVIAMKTFIIQQNDQGQRLDKFLTKSVPLLPKSLLYKSIRKKRIKVNGKRCELNYKLCLGDQVDLYLNDEFFSS